MTQQEKQINYMGPFITMVFLFFIVGFLTTANTQFQGPLKETFLSEVGGLKNTFATLITFSWFLAYPVCGGVGSSWISKYIDAWIAGDDCGAWFVLCLFLFHSTLS